MAEDFDAKAQALLQNMSEEDKAGMRDLHLLTMSMAVPVIRDALSHFAANRHNGAQLEAIEKQIQQIIPEVTERGSYKVEFINKQTHAPDVMYVMLDMCPADHDFSVEFSRHLPAEGREGLNKHISFMIQICRAVYSQITRENLELLRRIAGNEKDYLDLKVDLKNTTLYVSESLPMRIGIVLRSAPDSA